jgi:hypothetical protein
MAYRFALFLVVLGGYADAVSALSRIWPSATAPCNTTLQACVNGSGVADRVEVASNAVIAESINLSKPFELVAARGYRPIIAAGQTISGVVNAAGTWAWRVEGFELEQGLILLQINGGATANVFIRNNRVLQAMAPNAEIILIRSGAITTTLNYDISENDLHVNADGGTSVPAVRALEVRDIGTGTGISSGRIRENRITAVGSSAGGIVVIAQNRTHRTELLGNHVRGGDRAGVFLGQGDSVGIAGGALTAVLLNNVLQSAVVGTRASDGFRINVYDGSLALTALHNTVVDARAGITVLVDPAATASGEIGGNLFAYLDQRGLFRSGVHSISDRDNLFFQSIDVGDPVGLSASSIFADPLLKTAPSDPHLRAGSPAIDVLDPTPLLDFLSANALPKTDGDGLRRYKFANSISKGALDIGALEAGDETLLHRVPLVAPGNTAIIDSAIINMVPAAAPQAIGNITLGVAGPTINAHGLSLRYLTAPARWELRQEDLAAFTPGAAFNLFAPGDGYGRFFQANTASNSTGALTYLENTRLNGQPDYIVLVTRNSGGMPISDMASPLSVNYSAGEWIATRTDIGTMPLNGGFDVYFQEPSNNAFRHRASPGNSVGSRSYIDHALLNANPCARFHAMHSGSISVNNNHHIALGYEGAPRNRWYIGNTDLATMPNNAEFHVLVDPQAVACPSPNLFANGFE